MASQPGPVHSGRVTTEGDSLFYEVRGHGPPLLLIAPGGGDGWQYAWIADILADEFTVITYDRRANARSTMNAPQNFEISQQSRDAVAVLHAVGETSAFVFGNSSGAVIALDLAKTRPQAVRAVVAHEAPLARLHPEARKWQRFFARVYATAFSVGASVAALRFMLGVQLPVRQLITATKAVNLHRKHSPEPYLSDKVAVEVLTKLELLPVTNYVPDVAALTQHGVAVYVAAGSWALTKQTWLAEIARVLAGQLGSDLVTFPGHHGAFLDQPAAFAAALRDVIHRAQDRATRTPPRTTTSVAAPPG